jgi:hypothetical protein
MIALAVALAFTTSIAVAGARPCDGVVDRTPECAPPKEGGPPVLADAKAPANAPANGDAFDITGLPAELGFLSFSLAFGGGAGLVLGLVPTPSNDSELVAQEVAVYTGAGLLVWSALVAGGAVALWAFDASNGTMRVPIDAGAE